MRHLGCAKIFESILEEGTRWLFPLHNHGLLHRDTGSIGFCFLHLRVFIHRVQYSLLQVVIVNAYICYYYKCGLLDSGDKDKPYNIGTGYLNSACSA